MKATVDTAALRASLPVPAAAPSNAVHALTAVATPTAPDRPPAPDGAGARRFAELLRERRGDAAATPHAVAAPAAATPTDAPKGADAPAGCEAGDDAATTTPPRAAPPAKARASLATRATGKAAVEQQATPMARDDEAREDDDAAQHAVAATPSTTADERAATLPFVATRPAMRDGTAGRDDGAATAASATDTRAPAADASQAIDANAGTAAVRARGMAAVDAAADSRTPARDGAAQHASAATTFASTLGETLRAAVPTPLHAAARVDAPFAPLANSSAVVDGAPPRDAAAAPTTVALATPIDAPDFAAALGVEVSVLARDGVQHAELHLHPLETGPVSIRIEVDGTNARVDFGADLAATRDAIERGLPELASALRDAGLTLAGGGVSQHAGSRPRGDDDATDGARPRGAAAPIAAAAVPPRVAGHRVAAGGVDVYA